MSTLKESIHLKIPFHDVQTATNNFESCIGKGGYGMVYKGELIMNGKSTAVAVKRLNRQFGQGLKEFLMEIQLLTGQNHPNLITLVAYCDDGTENIIVYEYAEHGSLDQYLTGNNTFCNLTWLKRLEICVDAARGLNHLHNHVGKHQTIIHRDIKSSNILLGQNWVAKISDLGLSKLSLAGLNRSAVISHPCGTPGYGEPEYFSTGIVKKESDVYSFGMVLFEVLCGRLCFTKGKDDLLFSGPLAKKYYRRKKLDEIVDPCLREQMSLDLMNKFSTIAYECLHDDREQRPPMDLVVNKLEELLKIQMSSYSLESSSKIRDEIMGAQESNKPAFASSEPSSMSLKENHNVSTSIISYETSHESSDLELGSFDNTLDVGVNTIAISSHLNKEGTHLLLENDQEVVKMILDVKSMYWKNPKLVELVEHYFDNMVQLFDFCDLLERSLKKVRDTRLMTFVALHHFDDEDGVEETLNFFKSIKAVGDPFTQDFFSIFKTIYRQQVALLEKLTKSKAKFNKNQFLIKKMIFNNVNGGQGEVVSSMQIGSYTAIRELDTIRFLVDKLTIDIENLNQTAEFAIKIRETVKFVSVDIKKKLDSVSSHLEELEMNAKSCTHTIQRARKIVLQRIIKS